MTTTKDRKLTSTLSIQGTPVEFTEKPHTVKIKHYLTAAVDLFFDVLVQIERNLEIT
ncbi:hypothetical protein CKA32_000911 [Geitlerinema sp. FC II]|uniref:hypothetical protein n=1 Tax=Baaleninema simplex TaxID=2862350 RepID=UPI00034CF446|nr:hypothetical protein [Baaleninema simplex]MDC0835398.1 hypothetical protein [Geitlerinema sp. CS-897]PPT11170.1 hypothetical protein CKA32_000911 [Geitlerinema sp. FC II]